MSIFGWRLKLVWVLLIIMTLDDMLLMARTCIFDILISIGIVILIGTAPPKNTKGQ